MTERIWEVRVDCYQEGVPKPTVRWFLVHGKNMDDAIKSAVYTAEMSCEFGPRWVEFQWRQAHSVVLPIEIKDRP